MMIAATSVMCRCGNHPANIDTGYCDTCEQMFAEYSQRSVTPYRAFFRGYRMSKSEVAQMRGLGWVCTSFTMADNGGFAVSDWYLDIKKDESAAF